jgi:hypothetical protein
MAFGGSPHIGSSIVVIGASVVATTPRIIPNAPSSSRVTKTRSTIDAIDIRRLAHLTRERGDGSAVNRDAVSCKFWSIKFIVMPSSGAALRAWPDRWRVSDHRLLCNSLGHRLMVGTLVTTSM